MSKDKMTIIKIDDPKHPFNPEDTIVITSDGKTVIARATDGRLGIASCSPEDEFSLATGAQLALKRLLEFQVGDWVECIKPEYSYTTYLNFIKEYCNKDECARYAYGQEMPKGTVGKVIGIHKHDFTNLDLVIVDTSYTGGSGAVYIVETKGLQRIQ